MGEPKKKKHKRSWKVRHGLVSKKKKMLMQESGFPVAAFAHRTNWSHKRGAFKALPWKDGAHNHHVVVRCRFGACTTLPHKGPAPHVKERAAKLLKEVEARKRKRAKRKPWETPVGEDQVVRKIMGHRMTPALVHNIL